MLEQMKISEFYQTVYRIRRIIDKVFSISKHVFEDRIRETRSFFHLSIPREILFQYKRFEDKVGDKIAYVLHRASLPKYYISLEKTYTPYIVHF